MRCSVAAIIALAMFASSSAAEARNILITNDDGLTAVIEPVIHAMPRAEMGEIHCFEQ